MNNSKTNDNKEYKLFNYLNPLASLVISLGCIVLVYYFVSEAQQIAILDRIRKVLYPGLLSGYISLIGFTLASYSVVLGLSSMGRFKRISERPKLFKQVLGVFHSGFIFLVIAALAVVSSLILDTGEFKCCVFPIVNILLLSVVFITLIKCILMLKYSTSLASKSSKGREGPDKRILSLDKAHMEAEEEDH